MELRSYREIELSVSGFRKGIGQRQVDLKVLRLAKYLGDDFYTIDCSMKKDAKKSAAIYQLKVSELTVDKINQEIIRVLE
jgi:hypothetical protein